MMFVRNAPGRSRGRALAYAEIRRVVSRMGGGGQQAKAAPKDRL